MYEQTEITEQMTIRLMSDERESGGLELIIDVRVYQEDSALFAEPLAYKIVGGAEELYGKPPREWDMTWAIVRMIVDSEYTPDELERIALDYPAFEDCRRRMKTEMDADQAWAQRMYL